MCRPYFVIVLASLITLSSLGQAKDFGVGNGGDAIQCKDQKVYALDYVLNRASKIPLSTDLVQAKSVDEILQKISQNLRRKLPEMADSLDDFRKFNELPDPSQKRIWENYQDPLVYLKDQHIQSIPQDCLGSDGNLRVIQAVIRLEPTGDGFIKYLKQQKALDALAQNSALQLSFLYIHEWLRDYTNDPVQIRDLNWYLHSHIAFQISATKLRATLEDFGLSKAADMMTRSEADQAKAERTKLDKIKHTWEALSGRINKDIETIAHSKCDRTSEKRALKLVQDAFQINHKFVELISSYDESASEEEMMFLPGNGNFAAQISFAFSSYHPKCLWVADSCQSYQEQIFSQVRQALVKALGPQINKVIKAAYQSLGIALEDSQITHEVDYNPSTGMARITSDVAAGSNSISAVTKVELMARDGLQSAGFANIGGSPYFYEGVPSIDAVNIAATQTSTPDPLGRAQAAPQPPPAQPSICKFNLDGIRDAKNSHDQLFPNYSTFINVVNSATGTQIGSFYTSDLVLPEIQVPMN